MNQCQNDWYGWLAMAKFAYNDQIHALTHSSPFMLDTRHNPQLSLEPLRESCLETLNDFTSKMDTVMQEAHSSLAQVANDMAWFYDTHCREALLYAVGDKVWLNGQNITTTWLMKKLDHKWLSP